MFKYSIHLAWSDEDECYVATIPELPGLSALGDTPEEAVIEAKIAAEGFIAVLKEDGEKVPDPQKTKRYSGQTRLRLPLSLHERLAKEAEREGVSLNSYMVYLLSSNLNINAVRKQLVNLGKGWVQGSGAAPQRFLKTTSRPHMQTSGVSASAVYDLLRSSRIIEFSKKYSSTEMKKEVSYERRN